MGSRPKTPRVVYPDPPPPAPERNDADTAALAESQRSGFFRRSGRAGTFLNGTGGTAATGAMRFLQASGV